MQETDILLDVSLPVIITYYSQLRTKQFLKYSNANNKNSIIKHNSIKEKRKHPLNSSFAKSPEFSKLFQQTIFPKDRSNLKEVENFVARIRLKKRKEKKKKKKKEKQREKKRRPYSKLDANTENG